MMLIEILADEIFPGNSGDFRGHLIGKQDFTAIIKHENPVIAHFDNLLEMPARFLLRLRGRSRRPSFVHGRSRFASPLPLFGDSVFHGSAAADYPAAKPRPLAGCAPGRSSGAAGLTHGALRTRPFKDCRDELFPPDWNNLNSLAYGF